MASLSTCHLGLWLGWKNFLNLCSNNSPDPGVLTNLQLLLLYLSVSVTDFELRAPLGPLVVTPEMVAKKIKAMKDNKSAGVDGILPKLLMETVEQISIPLARVFNLSLKEGVVPFEWKEANIIPLFKKGSRNKSENYRQVRLTSVICKLLERLIKDQEALVLSEDNK